jgi:hypothetical protein
VGERPQHRADLELMMAVTPGFRDVIWHLQFISVLGMTAVQWPNFACTSRVVQGDDVQRLIYLDVSHVDPILATTSWSNLVGSECPVFDIRG